MNRRLLDRLRTITRLDNKTNEQMMIKITEEVGELARALLIFGEVHGTKYREPVAKEDVAEEMADSVICIVALAEKMGIDHTMLSRMLEAKMDKWEFVLGVSVRECPDHAGGCEYVILTGGAQECRHCRVEAPK